MQFLTGSSARRRGPRRGHFPLNRRLPSDILVSHIAGFIPASRASRMQTRRFIIFSTISKLRSTIAKRGIKQIDLKFTDLFGRWHHITVPPSRVNEKLFTSGVGFDGSNFPGMSAVESGDLALVPELGTGYLDPFRTEPAISFICRIAEADSKKPFSRDPRSIAGKPKRTSERRESPTARCGDPSSSTTSSRRSA